VAEVTQEHIRIAERCVERPYNRGSVDRAAKVIAEAFRVLDAERSHFQELAEHGLEPRMKSMRLENGEVNLQVTGPMVEAMAMAYVLHFKGIGATTFVEFNIHDREEPFQRYTVTVQKVSGKTPADLLNECKANHAALVEAAEAVLAHRVGDLPTQGHLRDNDKSRAAIGKLAAALAAVREGQPK
jgi:hypothetical protein